MDYNKRIDDNFLKADYVDGEVLQHTDMNELESVVKLGVNANYEDIQKIQDGTISVENSNKLSGATLSKVSSETLQNSDVKVPTSAQVKQYIDSAISSIDLTGYASEVFVENEIADTVAIYDSNGNGIVDNAEKVNNHTVLKDVPSDAKFTDTIYDDTEVRGLISDLDDDKVDKVTGKGLSTNDFTNTYKTKLDGIANNAQVNVIEKVKVNGTQQTISNKSVNISVPTQLSQLSDDSTHRLVTDTEKTTWNNKADISDIPSLTNYVKNTDYASTNRAGVFKTLGAYGTVVDGNGYLLAGSYTYPQYENIYDTSFISKGTLENVITGKNLETADNKVTEITESSTDTEYPSAKAVYDFASGGAEEEEIEALREEDEYLNSVIDQLPRDEATGTSATLQPTIQARMKMSLAPSEMTQHSYSGKNLLPNELTSQEINGLTIGVDSDGVVSISGTANAQTILNLYLNQQSTITVPSGTCYLSTNLGGTVTGGSSPAWFKILGTNNVQESMDITNADGMSFSVASDWNLAIGQIICQESQTFTNVKIYPMVSTSSDMTYEPYVGGTATPSPSYPEEIHTISGSNSVVVEGKNIFPLDTTKFPITSSAGNLTAILNEDGSIHVTGTKSTSGWENIALPRINDAILTFYKGVTYTTTIVFGMTEKVSGTWVGNKTGTFTPTEDWVNTNGYWTTNATGTIDRTIYSMVMTGTGTIDSSTFVPYQGTQEVQLNFGVENLLYLENGSRTDRGITSTRTNGVLTCQGTTTSTYYNITDFANINLPAGTYTFSIDKPLTHGLKLRLKDADNNISTFTIQAGDTSKILTTTNTKTSFYLFAENSISSGQSINETIYIQLEKGTKANSYTPYGTTPIEYCKIGNYEDEFIRNSGKNLISEVGNKVGNSIYFNGVSSAETYQFKAGTYTFSYSDTNSATLYIKDTTGTQSSLGTAKTTTFTSNYDFNIWLYRSGITIEELNEAMLEKGNQATDYEPYGTNQWYLKKNIGKVVLDGTGYWGIASEGDTTNGFSMYTTSVTNIISNMNKPLMSDKFNYISRGSITSSSINFVYSGATNVVVLNIDRTLLNEESIAGFKSWLSTELPYLYYPLATPTYTQITGTLETQLNNIYKNMLSYKGTTNVSQINNDLPFVLGVSAIKDINAMISELTNAIIELGGE